MITFEECKGYDMIRISKREAMKDDVFESLSAIKNTEVLRGQVLTALENGGRVYGLKKKKEVVALIIFEKEEKSRHEFEELIQHDEELGITLEKLPKGLRKVVIYKLVTEYNLAGHDEAMAWFQKSVRADMQSLIAGGSCYLVHMKDETLSLQQIEEENFGFNGGGLAIGLSIGLIFGIVMDNIGLGLCFGILYSLMFGNISSGKKTAEAKNEEETHL